MARKTPTTAAATEIAARPFDAKVEYVEMKRAELKDAAYNPRVINDEEKRRLRKIINKHGLVSAPTWNKRTGHVVGGHQRLSQMDALHGSPNYTVMVGVIDVSEVEEKEINIGLNNPAAQGDWDLGKLEDLLKVPEMDLSGAGFDAADIYQLFGDLPGVQWR